MRLNIDTKDTTKSYGRGLGIGNSRYIALELDAISVSLIDCFNMSSDAETAGENTAKGFETVEAIHPLQMTDFLSYAPSRMAYTAGTTENYYSSSTSI